MDFSLRNNGLSSVSLDLWSYRSWRIFVLCAFVLVPLKLSWSYGAFIPILLVWLGAERRLILPWLWERRVVMVPYLIFLLWTYIGALIGINPLNSLEGACKLSFFSLVITFSARAGLMLGTARVVVALLVGQGIAAYHSVFASYCSTLPSLFVGTVSESGQLSIQLVLAVGLVLAARRCDSRSVNRVGYGRHFIELEIGRPRDILSGLITIILLGMIAFQQQVHVPETVLMVGVVVTSLMLVLAVAVMIKVGLASADGYLRIQTTLVAIVLPFLTAALLVNLKRGPWVGVTVGLSILLLFFARRLLIPLSLTAAIILLTVEPVQIRLAQSSRDFFISGGRSVIWRVGTELAARYPSGIGFDNSSVLRRFDPSIPSNLKHFHSNSLNLLVETGWIGLALFMWWFVSLIGYAFSRKRSPQGFDRILGVSVGCALISWQFAGLVEYNFGDSEVLFVAYIVIGLLLRHKSAIS